MNEADKNRSVRLHDVLRDVCKGDRELLISRSKLSKGRISQLLGGEEAFGERAARSIELKLGLRRGYLDEKPGPHAVNEPQAVYSGVTDVIRIEQEIAKEPFVYLHMVLKALHIYDDTERELTAAVKKEAEKAAIVWENAERALNPPSKSTKKAKA